MVVWKGKSNQWKLLGRSIVNIVKKLCRMLLQEMGAISLFLFSFFNSFTAFPFLLFVTLPTRVHTVEQYHITSTYMIMTHKMTSLFLGMICFWKCFKILISNEIHGKQYYIAELEFWNLGSLLTYIAYITRWLHFFSRSLK